MATISPPAAYLLITLEAQVEALEAASIALFDCGAEGVVEEQGLGGLRLKAYFPVEEWPRRRPGLLKRLEAVTRYFPSLKLVEESRLEATDWSENWKKHHRPLVLGPLWIGPPWLVEEAPAGQKKLVLDPGQAFGTGGHATTRLCLEALMEHLTDKNIPTMLDVGVGSGVLALAGLMLGVQRATGLDVDPEALSAARLNAQRNGLAARLQLSPAPLTGLSQAFPLVTANLTGPLLTEMAGSLSLVVAPGGRLIVSGLLVEELDQVLPSFRPALKQLVVRRMGEWAGAVFDKPEEV